MMQDPQMHTLWSGVGWSLKDCVDLLIRQTETPKPKHAAVCLLGIPPPQCPSPHRYGESTEPSRLVYLHHPRGGVGGEVVDAAINSDEVYWIFAPLHHSGSLCVLQQSQ